MASLINSDKSNNIPIDLKNNQPKVVLFEKIINTIKQISGLRKDIEYVGADSSQASIAFLIEETSVLYKDQDWPAMIEQMVTKIQQFAKEGDRIAQCEVTHFLDTRVRLVYQTVMTEKISKAKNEEEIANWNSLITLQTFFSKCNEEQHAKGEPVSYLGIAADMLPAWYCERIEKEKL